MTTKVRTFTEDLRIMRQQVASLVASNNLAGLNEWFVSENNNLKMAQGCRSRVNLHKPNGLSLLNEIEYLETLITDIETAIRECGKAA
jgi:hypothetical protein